MTSAREGATDWRCKPCGRRAVPNYDHAGGCRETSAEDDCVGTFAHPQRSTCESRGRDLTHEMVEARSHASVDVPDPDEET